MKTKPAVIVSVHCKTSGCEPFTKIYRTHLEGRPNEPYVVMQIEDITFFLTDEQFEVLKEKLNKEVPYYDK